MVPSENLTAYPKCCGMNQGRHAGLCCVQANFSQPSASPVAEPRRHTFNDRIDFYKERIVLRPQDQTT